ncbi:MAG: metallophosphoesterase [Armatimonadota bacterium]|nr:metallophosphoesterase [bacterium]
MDTSINARIAMALITYGLVCIIAYENLRTVVLLILKRKLSRFAKFGWPALALLVVFCVMDAFYIEPHWVQVTHHTIQTKKLPMHARLRIVQLTDFHITRFDGREEAAIRLTANRRPDIIVLTGDYLNGKTPDGYAALTQIGRRLSKIAPTYAVEGNWDSYPSMKALEKGGVKPVKSWITVPTRNGGKIAIGQLLWWVPVVNVYIPSDIKPMYKILLCHKPDPFYSINGKGIDLMLSGHTHGGQVRLPVFGALLPDRELLGKYQAGLYRNGSSALYVNRGLGMENLAPLVRFWCRPEVAVIDVVGQ